MPGLSRSNANAGARPQNILSECRRLGQDAGGPAADRDWAAVGVAAAGGAGGPPGQAGPRAGHLAIIMPGPGQGARRRGAPASAMNFRRVSSG